MDAQPLVTHEPQVIDGLASQLTSVYDAVKAAAPNAKIIVLGYPHVVDDGSRRVDADCFAFDQPTVDFLTQMTDRLDGVIASSATSAGVTHVSPVATFDGPPDHSACTPNITDEWINSIILINSSGSGTTAPGTGGSFHPDANGHSAEAALIKPLLP